MNWTAKSGWARSTGAFALATALVLMPAAPAAAKGPEAVRITSPASAEHPGGETVELPAIPDHDGGQDERLAHLAGDLGLWQAMDQDIPLPQEPPASPGPGFPVEWTMHGPSGDLPIAQTLYPQAPGGPLVHTEPGQMAYGVPVPGGWFQAAPRVLATLESLGWTTKASVVAPRQVAPGKADPVAAVAAGDAEGSPSGRMPTPAVLGGGALVVIAATLFSVARRLRRAATATR